MFGDPERVRDLGGGGDQLVDQDPGSEFLSKVSNLAVLRRDSARREHVARWPGASDGTGQDRKSSKILRKPHASGGNTGGDLRSGLGLRIVGLDRAIAGFLHLVFCEGPSVCGIAHHILLPCARVQATGSGRPCVLSW